MLKLKLSSSTLALLKCTHLQQGRTRRQVYSHRTRPVPAPPDLVLYWYSGRFVSSGTLHSFAIQPHETPTPKRHSDIAYLPVEQAWKNKRDRGRSSRSDKRQNCSVQVQPSPY